MPVLQLGRYRDLAAAVAGRLDASTEVIVASAGVANAITAEVLRGSPRGVSGLRLQTIENFARRVLNDAGEYPRVATDAERRLAMRVAVSGISDPMMESRGIATMLERSYRDVRDSGLALAEFEAGVHAAGALRNRGRTQLVLRAWRDYERLIDRAGAIDAADLLSRAATLIAQDAVIAPQMVAGFYDMTGAQLQVVDALREEGKLVTIDVPAGEAAPYAFATRFVTHFSSLAAHRAALIEVNSPGWSVEQYENRADELRGVCGKIADLLAAGTAPRSIGLVARSLEAYDIRLLNRFAAEHGFTTTAEENRPLIAQRVGRGVATLLRLRDEGFPRGSVIELLRDGFIAERRVRVDEVDVATRRARIAGGTTQMLRHVTSRPFVDDYLAVLGEMETLVPTEPLSGAEVAALLRTMTLRFPVETESDAAAADAVDRVADTFRRASGWRARFDVATVLDALQQEQLRSPNRDLPAVWAGDVMRFRGRSFEHVFAVRMEDEVFPQRRVEDPLLPDSDRRALGVREIGDGRDEERLLFQLILDASSTAVHFTLSGSDGFGKLLRPSPLVKQFAIEQRPQERAELLRDFGKMFAVPFDAAQGRRGSPAAASNCERQLQLLARAGARSVFDGYLFADAVDEAVRVRVEAALQSVSPTHLEDFGECPQKFFFKHILGARDIDDPEHELQLNAREKGKIDHKILESFYRAVTEEDMARAALSLPQLDPSLAVRIDALVDEAFQSLHEGAPPFNPTMREIERRATKRILHEFLANDLADLHATGLRPREFEYKFATTREFGRAVIRIDGTIDRIDANAGRYRVIDYKGGRATRHKDLGKKIDRGVRLQLPLYALAVAQLFGAGASEVSGAIKPLVVADTKPERFAFELADKEIALRETLELFAASIQAARFPAFPADDDKDFNACKYCPVNHSCRTRHDAVEKYAVLRFRDPRTLLGATQ